jgi:hypothetical protein
MLKPRTKLLITLSALAPAAILIYGLDYQAAIPPGERSQGFAGYICVEPGFLINAMLCVGCIAFLFAIVSTISDVRQNRS